MTPEGDRVSVAVRVVGVSEAEVTTAIAIEPRRGRPFRAIVGAQVEKMRPREYLNASVIDTEGLGLGTPRKGQGDAH